MASQPRRALKERNAATTHSLQDGQAMKTITGQNQKEQKVKETNQTKEQWLEAGRLALVQDKIRKALAPFFTICQSTTQQKLQQQQCRQADQSIIAALKADRDVKFAKMGTCKITKKVSRNGSVCFKTEATDKLVYFLQQIKDPVKRIAFYEEQTELRKTYLQKNRHRRRIERAKAAKLHPIDVATIIHKGMNEGEKMIDKDNMARLSATTIKPKGNKKIDTKGLINIKTKNVNSIKGTQGSREETVMTHFKQTPQKWDAWVFTETWRPDRSEIVDFDAEAESEEEVEQTDHETGKEELAAEKEGVKKTCVSPRCTRHCLFGCGGKTARGVAIVINARHSKSAEMEVVNENVCAVNLRLQGQRTCIIAVYMPHAGKCSGEQEIVYTEISKLIKNAKKNKRVVVLAGDFNAVVGKTGEEDYASTSRQAVSQACGTFGHGTRNQKGQRLHQFCTQENLTIGNTIFDKPSTNLWTHRGVKAGGEENLRQIDYIMIGSNDRWRLQNVDTEDELCVGGDHRTVTATLKLKKRQPKNKKNCKRETIANLKSWQPLNKDHYAADFDKAITAECCNNPDWTNKSNSDKVDCLEKLFILTAAQHTKPSKKDVAKVPVYEKELQNALAGRKYYRLNKQYKEAAQMARYAQKLAKRNSRSRIK